MDKELIALADRVRALTPASAGDCFERNAITDAIRAIAQREPDAESARLRKLLADARDDIADWAAYASPYFQEKHDLAGTLARYDAAIAAEQENSNASG